METESIGEVKKPAAGGKRASPQKRLTIEETISKHKTEQVAFCPQEGIGWLLHPTKRKSGGEKGAKRKKRRRTTHWADSFTSSALRGDFPYCRGGPSELRIIPEVRYIQGTGRTKTPRDTKRSLARSAAVGSCCATPRADDWGGGVSTKHFAGESAAYSLAKEVEIREQPLEATKKSKKIRSKEYQEENSTIAGLSSSSKRLQEEVRPNHDCCRLQNINERHTRTPEEGGSEKKH